MMNENDTKIIDFKRMCRLCLRERKILSNIFKTYEENSKVTVYCKIMACASVNLNENDGLPNGICTECLSSVNAAFEFRKQCENADKTLHDIQTILWKHQHDNKVNEYAKVPDTEKHLNIEEKNEIEETNSIVLFEKVNVEPAPEKLRLIITTPKKFEVVNRFSQSGSTFQKSEFKFGSFSSDVVFGKPEGECEASNQRLIVSNNQECYKVVVPSKEEPKVGATNMSYSKKNLKPNKTLVKTVCPFCNKTLGRLDQHIRLFHRNRVYICTNQNCGAEFLTLKNLQSHQLACYNVKKAYKCSGCLKEFHRKSNLKAHVRRHSDKKEFQCQLCDRAFVDSTGLRRHFLKHHEPEQEIFISGCCGKKFKSKEGLKKHIRNGTCGVENFQNDSESIQTVKIVS